MTYASGCEDRKAIADYRIYVEIVDGKKGFFDLKHYLNHGVFRELQDAHYFAQVGILFGAVSWPHGQDIAPETLLAEMIPAESTMSDQLPQKDAPQAARS